jgi:AAA15 family ATPase/GTPase
MRQPPDVFRDRASHALLWPPIAFDLSRKSILGEFAVRLFEGAGLCPSRSMPNNGGYSMITEFEINNFRCFEHLSLKGLRTINILVGDNGSGKTALLEAFALATLAQPGAATSIRAGRNRPLPQAQANWNPAFFKSLWEDLFFNFKDSQTISAKFTDTLWGTLTVHVSYRRPPSKPAFAAAGFIPELLFSRTGSDGDKPTETVLTISDQGTPIIHGYADPMPIVYVYPSLSEFYLPDIVTYYSELVRQNRESYVATAMKRNFPQISNISILHDADSPGLFVTTDAIPDRKVPLAVVSSGAARYLNMLSAIAMHPQGVVLIDEIENGFYWRKMPSIWKTLLELCSERGAQLFAATHSNECLQALVQAMRGHENDFSLIRTEVSKEGRRAVRQFDGKTFRAALEQHGEVR